MHTTVTTLLSHNMKEVRLSMDIHIPVHQWVYKPLKLLVENAVKTKAVPRSTYSTPQYKALSTKAKKRNHERILIQQWMNYNEIKVTLEPSDKGLQRTVNSWDAYFREAKYANDLGVELPLVRTTDKLYNTKIMFNQYMRRVVVGIKLLDEEDHTEYEIQQDLQTKLRYLIEPTLAMKRIAVERGLADPIVLVEVSDGINKPTVSTLDPEGIDDRPIIRVYDENMGQFVFTRAKLRKDTQFENVYSYDPELKPPRIDFIDYANALVEADTRYNGDIIQALKDIKDYYYSRPYIKEALQQYYAQTVEDITDFDETFNGTDYNTYLENVYNMNESPLEDRYPVQQVMEEYLEESNITLE